MSAKHYGFDLLGAIKDVQTPLFLTIVGFRKSIARHMGLKQLPIIFHDDVKSVIRREQQAEYPYGYFRMSGFEIQKDMQAVKTIRRHGSSRSLDDITNAMITKGYLFPASITMEMHFLHNDAREMLLFVEKLSVLGSVDGFSFVVNMQGTSEWTVGVFLDEGPISIPEVTLESEEEPAAFDITVSFTLKTRAGIVKSVPKINNEGHVNRRLVVPDNQVENIGEPNE